MRNHSFWGALTAGSLLFVGCPNVTDLTTITLGEEEGIPPIDGNTSVTLPANFQCGQDIPSDGAYTITSQTVNGGDCLLHMEGEFEVVPEDVYNSDTSGLAGNSVDLVQDIRLSISNLTIDDGTNNLDLNATFNSFDVSVSNEQILDLQTIGTIPTSVSLGDATLDAFKTGMSNKQPVVVPSVIDAVVKAAVVANLPATLNVDFQAQPEIVVGVLPTIQ